MELSFLPLSQALALLNKFKKNSDQFVKDQTL